MFLFSSAICKIYMHRGQMSSYTHIIYRVMYEIYPCKKYKNLIPKYGNIKKIASRVKSCLGMGCLSVFEDTVIWARSFWL